MAKLKNDPITSDDFVEYLNSQSDFSFELEVLRMLTEYGIDCEHGGHYEDPVTNKSREFDIRATRTIKNYRVRLAVECKNIRENFPILISCIPRQKWESFHQVALVAEPKVDPVSNVFSSQTRAKIVDISGKYSLYKEQGLVGKSTVQVGRVTDGSLFTNDGELYEKWGQCLSSAKDLINQMYWDGDEQDADSHFFSATFPFVVVPNGRLWVVSYDENGKLTSAPTQADRCSCFINKKYVMNQGHGTRTCLNLSHVEIVTYNGLRSFVEQYLNIEQGIAQIFPPDGILEFYNLKFG